MNPYEGLSQSQLDAMTPSQIDKLKKLDPRFAVAVEKLFKEKKMSENIYADAIDTDAFVTFRTLLRGIDRAFFTDDYAERNVQILYEWAAQNDLLLDDARTVGFWQITFANCKDRLTVDPNAPFFQQEWNAFRKRVMAMSVAELKRAYAQEVGFKERYDTLQAAEDANYGAKGI